MSPGGNVGYSDGRLVPVAPAFDADPGPGSVGLQQREAAAAAEAVLAGLTTVAEQARALCVRAARLAQARPLPTLGRLMVRADKPESVYHDLAPARAATARDGGIRLVVHEGRRADHRTDSRVGRHPARHPESATREDLVVQIWVVYPQPRVVVGDRIHVRPRTLSEIVWAPAGADGFLLMRERQALRRLSRRLLEAMEEAWVSGGVRRAASPTAPAPSRPTPLTYPTGRLEREDE